MKDEICRTLALPLNATETQILERLKAWGEALSFYADPETYFAIGFLPDNPAGEFMEDFSECPHPYHGGEWVKPGKRAREAIHLESIAHREKHEYQFDGEENCAVCGEGMMYYLHVQEEDPRW